MIDCINGIARKKWGGGFDLRGSWIWSYFPTVWVLKKIHLGVWTHVAPHKYTHGFFLNNCCIMRRYVVVTALIFPLLIEKSPLSSNSFSQSSQIIIFMLSCSSADWKFLHQLTFQLVLPVQDHSLLSFSGVEITHLDCCCIASFGCL